MFRLVMGNFVNYMNYEKKLSKNSLEAYIRDINIFRDYLNEINICNFTEINKTNVITYLVYLQKKGKATSTISRNLASIRCLFQYLLNNNMIKEDPTLNLKSPKMEKKIPSVLSIEEVKKLLELPNDMKPKGSRDKAILELIYGTGLRVSEINSLNIEDIDLNMGIVKVQNSEGKFIRISSDVINCLSEYLDNFRIDYKLNDPLFINYKGGRISRQGLWKILRSYSDKFEDVKNITPQVLRNTSSAHLSN